MKFVILAVNRRNSTLSKYEIEYGSQVQAEMFALTEFMLKEHASELVLVEAAAFVDLSDKLELVREFYRARSDHDDAARAADAAQEKVLDVVRRGQQMGIPDSVFSPNPGA